MKKYYWTLYKSSNEPSEIYHESVADEHPFLVPREQGHILINWKEITESEFKLWIKSHKKV